MSLTIAKYEATASACRPYTRVPKFGNVCTPYRCHTFLEECGVTVPADGGWLVVNEWDGENADDPAVFDADTCQ
jgi:hypothetical protein